MSHPPEAELRLRWKFVKWRAWVTRCWGLLEFKWVQKNWTLLVTRVQKRHRFRCRWEWWIVIDRLAVALQALASFGWFWFSGFSAWPTTWLDEIRKVNPDWLFSRTLPAIACTVLMTFLPNVSQVYFSTATHLEVLVPWLVRPPRNRKIEFKSLELTRSIIVLGWINDIPLWEVNCACVMQWFDTQPHVCKFYSTGLGHQYKMSTRSPRLFWAGEALLISKKTMKL